MRRAGLLARGHDRTGTYLARELRVDLRAADALHAKGALLHDTALTHGDGWVLRHPLRFRELVVVVEPVEAAHLVRTVVRAEARPDAAVVHHLIQPVIAVHRRVHGADVLARRLLAVL